MADQKINALPSKTAPTTGDKMLMVGTAEEYLIDYDKLATAILNKLSSQSFSSLDTTAKTVLGAVNELNSKSYGNTIYYNANTDRDIIENRYNAIKYVFENYGNIKNAYTMFVVRYESGSYYNYILMRQTADASYTILEYSYLLDNINIYELRPSTKEVILQKTFSDDATIFAGTAIQSGDDLNDYTTPGIYRSTSSSITASLLNIPETFVSGFSMLVFNMSLATNVQVIFAGDKMYMRFLNTGGWLKWFKYSGTQISS